jgi:hypothetical protein
VVQSWLGLSVTVLLTIAESKIVVLGGANAGIVDTVTSIPENSKLFIRKSPFVDSLQVMNNLKKHDEH